MNPSPRSASRRLEESQVAIVGLGLMGGSLAWALRGRCRAVVGVARRAETVETALARKMVDQCTIDLEDGLSEADVVVLAAPVRVILALLDEIGPLLRDGSLVLDLGSTKAQIVASMARLPEHVQPLGGHPMCGKELSGLESADSALFRGCTFVLSPLARTSEATLALGRAIVEALGAHPLVLDPQRHDRLVATISHLPYLLACALVGCANQLALDDAAVWDAAASGYRDASRLADSDVTMMLDILLTNQAAILDALATCQAQLRDLENVIKAADKKALRAALTDIRASRM